MNVSHIKISNILGIAELEFDAGKFTEITAKNGKGKTSIIEAMKSVFKGGHDATLLRNGAKRGEIVFVLDDGTELIKKVRAENSKTEVRRGGKSANAPMDFIKQLVDDLSVNPVEFLTARAKDRTNVLLEAMPIAVDVERLKTISGVPVSASEGVHGLQVIDATRKLVFDDRTGTNRAVKEKEATINQVRSAMPDAPEVDGDETELAAKAEAIRTAERTELTRIDTKLDGLRNASIEKVAGLRGSRDAALHEITIERDTKVGALQAKIAEIQRQIDITRTEAQTRIDQEKATAQAKIDDEEAEFKSIQGLATGQRERTIHQAAADLEPINASIASLRNNRTAAAKRTQALDTIKLMETELETLIADATKQTKALDAIDAYKQELLTSMPIPGLELREGEIYFNNVIFDRLNTAQRVNIAVELAKLRAGKLGIICVDGIECLDADHFERFKARAIDSGLQLFVSRVLPEKDASNELTVTSGDGKK